MMSTQAIYRTHRLALSAKSILQVAHEHSKQMPQGPLKMVFMQHLLFAITALEDLNVEFADHQEKKEKAQ